MPNNKKYDWQLVMETMCPKIHRPRRTSLHTLAAVTGRDPKVIAKEMKDSDLVVGYRCPDVRTLIFYLKSLAKHPGMIDTRDPQVWTKINDILKEYPYPQVKGFQRFAGGGSSGMAVPYAQGDEELAQLVRDKLASAGVNSCFVHGCMD